MSISLILLLIFISLVATPIFSPTGFYIIYSVISKKEKYCSHRMNCFKKIFVITSIITFLGTFLLTYFIVNNFSYFTSFNILNVTLILIIVWFIKILTQMIVFLFNITDIDEISKKLKRFNFCFNAILIIVLLLIPIKLASKTEEISKFISDSTYEAVEKYAKENDYIIFEGNHVKYTNDLYENYPASFLINYNDTHIFTINDNDNKNFIMVFDKLNPSNSFKVNYSYLDGEKIILENYKEIVDNFYIGANFECVCFLINENDANIVYGLAQKSNKTNEFYVNKYVIFNMTTGELSDLNAKNN